MAFTIQDRKAVMYDVVGTFNAAPGRTIFEGLTDDFINGATHQEITAALVATPLFEGEYPGFQTPTEFAENYITGLMGARDTLVDGALWDGVVDLTVSWLDADVSQADTIWFLTQYMSGAYGAVIAGLEDAAQALENKVDVALYQAVDLGQDPAGSTLEDLQAAIADVDETEASVTLAKAALDPAGGGTTFDLTADTALGADVMRITGDQDVRIDFTDSSNQITGLDLDGDGVIANDGNENNQSGIAADFEIVDAYARNPLNHNDTTNNFLGDIAFDGTGVDGDGVSTDGNVVLGGLGADTIFGGIGNDFLAGGGVARPIRYLDLDGDGDLEPGEVSFAQDVLSGGRNADFFFASLSALSPTDGDSLSIDGGSTTDDAIPEGGAEGFFGGGSLGQAQLNSFGYGDTFFDGFFNHVFDDWVTEDRQPETNQDSDWLLLEASDDDEPVEIALGRNGGGGSGSDEEQSLSTRSGVNVNLVEIEHIDASGNLYGFLDDLNVTIGERAGKDSHDVGTENTGIGASAQLIILGSEDDNIVIGGFDNDLIHGEDGDDLLFGGRTDFNNNPNLTGIVNDGMDALYGGSGNDDIVFEADGGIIDGEQDDDTLWLTNLAFGTQDADDMTSDGTVRIDLAAWQGYGGANFTTWTQDQTNYNSNSSRVNVDDMEHVIATGMGSVDYLAAGTNNPELLFNNQQNLGAIDSHLDLRGDSGNNWLLAAAGDDVIEGRQGDDNLSGGEGSDDFIFNLGNEYGQGGDHVDVIRRQADANNDNIWDGGWVQDFGLDDASTASDSTFTLGVPGTLAPYVDGIRFELEGTTYEITGLTASDFDGFLDNVENVIGNTTGLEGVTVSSPEDGIIVLTDAAGGAFVELTDNGWILTSGNLPSDGLDQWFQQVGPPTVEMSEDRLIYQSYEDRLDGERVDDDSVRGSTISLGEDHYAEDLVVNFADDGTRIAEDQHYRISFTNLTTEDHVTIEINGVTYRLCVGEDVDGNIIDDEDTLHTDLATIQTNFIARLAGFINSFMDDDTAAGQVGASASGNTLTVWQQDYNGEETVFMEKPSVTIEQNSLGEIATYSVQNDSEHELHLLDFDGRDNNLNQENVKFWGDQEINRAALETAAEAGGTVTGSEAMLIDGGADDLQDAVQGSGATIFDNQAINLDTIHPNDEDNFSVHGDDLLLGGGGVDTIAGGTGDDRILGSLGNDSVDGGKNFYRVQVLGEEQARVYELNAFEAGTFSISGQVIVSMMPIYQTENGHNVVSGIFDDTLQFQQFDFEAGVTEFTVTLDDYTISGGGAVQLINDGAGTVSVDVDGDGDFESVTGFTNFENVRTVSGIDEAIAGNGQGNDTLDVNDMSDDTFGVSVNMTNGGVQGQVKHATSQVDIVTTDGDGTTGQNIGQYGVVVINVDGIEHVDSGDGDDLVLIDETEAAKNNNINADDGFDRIDYQNVFATNALVAEPTATVKVNTSADTDQVVMTDGRVGTTVATDTLNSVEVIGLNSNTARSVREDDVLDVTTMTSGAVVDFVLNQVRDLSGNIQVYIENMSELENVWADGDDVVIVSDAMTNAREDSGVDATPSTDLQLFTFLDYDEIVDGIDNAITPSAAGTTRAAFSALGVGDIDNTLNQNQFTFNLSKTGSGLDDDIVDYSAESGTIISVTDFGDVDDDHYVLVDHDNDLDLTDAGSRVDHHISTEGLVASAGTSIIDLTSLGKDIELRYQKIADSPTASTNVAAANTKQVDLLFIDQDTNSAFNDFRYIEYYDDPDVGGTPGETALWNQVEGSDFNEKIEMTSDQLDTRHTFNLRGGDNEVNYNEQQSRGIELSIFGIGGGITTVDILGKDNGGVLNAAGTSDRVSSYNSNSMIPGSLRVEASQSEDDSIALGSVTTNNLFILGQTEGSDDVVEVLFDLTGANTGLTLTGFETLADSAGDDIFKIEDIDNILNTIAVTDNPMPPGPGSDSDTLQLTDSALDDFGTGADDFGDGSIEMDDLEDIIDGGADDGIDGFDFSVLDLSLLTEQVDVAITLDTADTAVPAAMGYTTAGYQETLVLGNLSNFGDQDDAMTDAQGFFNFTFTTTAGMGNDVVIDMDAGEFRADGSVLFTFDQVAVPLDAGALMTWDFSQITEDMTVTVVDTAGTGVNIITDPNDDVTGGGGDDFITGGAGADMLDGGIVPEVLETLTFDITGVMGSGGLVGDYIQLSDGVAGNWIRFHQDGSVTTLSGAGDQPAGTTALVASADSDLTGGVIASQEAAIIAELLGFAITDVDYDDAGVGGEITVTYATTIDPAPVDLDIGEISTVALSSNMEANLVPIDGATVVSGQGSAWTAQMDSSDTFIYNAKSESSLGAQDQIANFTIDGIHPIGGAGAADDVIDLSALNGGLFDGNEVTFNGAPFATYALLLAAAEATNDDIYVGLATDTGNAYVFVDSDNGNNVEMGIELTGLTSIAGISIGENFIV